jgi:DNA polymerase IV (DinB-like DNA polymerase)
MVSALFGQNDSKSFAEDAMSKKRIIFHVDMDHFFSAVEERENPTWKGKPVVVGADPKEGNGRGVVKTCNYEARAFNIHSGMPISKAWRLCPTAIYVRGNYRLCKEVSAEIMEILMKYSDSFEQWGLDEAFLDVSSKVEDFDEATELAKNVKRDVLGNQGLTCSVGVAPNKLVAKIASDFRKPDGLTVVAKEAERFLAPLPVRRLLWVGKKTESKLREMGIRTIGDLATFDVSALTEKFGIMGKRYHLFAQGLYESDVGGRRGRIKSVGHETTFGSNTNDYELILNKLDNLCERIHKRIDRRRVLFKTVTVKIRYENFQTHTHGKTLPLFTNRLNDLQKTARQLSQNYLQDKAVRLVGIRVSNLASIEGQRTLF